MELRQRAELIKLLTPELRQSLKMLIMSLPDMKQAIQQELTANPFLEESTFKEKIDPIIKKILKLDPKPGRTCSAETAQQIIPDIIISENAEGLEVTINDEDLPTLKINNE